MASSFVTTWWRKRHSFFPFCSCAGYRATSANESDPPANSWTVVLHKADPRYSNGWDTSLWLHLYPALLHSQQHLVRRQECCLPWLVCLLCYALRPSRRDIFPVSPFYLAGPTRCTTCLDSSFWFSSFYSSRAPRPQFCSVISTCVLRCLNVRK